MDRLSLPQRIPWRLAWTRRFVDLDAFWEGKYELVLLRTNHSQWWLLRSKITTNRRSMLNINLELQALSRVRACIGNCAACGAQRCSMSARCSQWRGEAEGHSNLWRKSRFVSVRATIVRGSVRLQKAMETFSSSAKINSVRVCRSICPRM